MSLLKFLFKVNIFLVLFLGGAKTYSQDIIDKNNFGTSYENFTQSPITTILKDHEGFMWIGTYGDGLYKYNSIDFKKYKQQFNPNKSSLNSSIILSSLKDSQNNIWIGTLQGLNRYNRELDKFESIKLFINNKVSDFEVHAIEELNDNTLLIGSRENGGLYKLNKEDLTLTLIPFDNKTKDKAYLIEAIVKTNKGRFLIGSNHGVLTFDPYNEVLSLAKFETKKGQETIINNTISMFKAKDNSIWIGTFSSGLFKLSEQNEIYEITSYPITKKRILSLAQKANQSILVGTENDGLFIVDCNTGKSKNYKYNRLKQSLIKSNSIWTVYSDDENRIWLGYYKKGIDLFDPNYNKFKSIKSTPYLSNSLNSSSVTAITRDKLGRFWISMNGGGVDIYDPKDSKFINLFNQNNSIATGLRSLDIQTIFIDSKDNIWIGTWNSGLYILKTKSKKIININSKTPNSVFKSNRIMSFDEDSKGNIWIGSFFGGLYSFNLNTTLFTQHNSPEFKKHYLHQSNIRKLIVDHQDNIWLATRSGVFKIKSNNNATYQITPINSLMNRIENQYVKSRIINSLFQDKNYNIWIGTLEYGLYKFNDKTHTLDWYNKKNGLIHDNVNLITQDKSGHIWIGGNNGLSKLNLIDNTFTNFSTKDGLLSNNFNYNSVYNSPQNTLYFGNSKGINYFNPDDIIYNQIKPNVYLTNLKISNEDIDPNTPESPLDKVISKTKALELEHYQSVLTFEYVGINYTRSQNNKYAYYLEGFENNWNYVGDIRSASYKSLPPGNYTFKVKASNNDGFWKDNPTTIDIKILYPWWKTKVAWFLYIILFILTNYLIFKFIKDRIKEKRILSFEREKHKQFTALNDKKIQFFTNISHEFRTPLTLILTPVEDIIENFDSQFSTDVKGKLNTIQKNAKRLSRLITELMDFRKLQFNKMIINASLINTVSFVQEVVSHFEEEAVQKNINLSVEYDDSDITIWSDPSMLEKIIFNLLSNAFKATNEGGQITVLITKKTSNPIIFPLIDEKKAIPATEIVIKDTGIGIKEENISKVFDRFHQADEMDDQYYGGTGIGLELVKSFMDLHKGKIILESNINEGSLFKIYFPIGYSHLKIENFEKKQVNAINEYSENKNIDSEEKNINSEEKSINKKMILIVEDNLELRTYLKNDLKNDYDIKEAKNGLEGLEKANKLIPDIIITDVMMPIMDGFELCERIKNDLKTSHIPLLMITAKGLQIDKVKGIDSGADIYLNKPFNMKVLKSHLKQLITSRQILFEKYFNDNTNVFVSDNITSMDKEFINTVLTYINENITDEKLNVENLARELLLSRSKLYRKIKALTGDTANEFIRKVRLEKAKKLIENSEYSISEISYKVGFSSPSYFTKCFRDYFEVLPTEIKD